jgi:ketosteroid isomerase-like protein
LGQSFVNRDIDTTSKIELDDFILADHLGKLWTKAEHIAATKDSLLTSFDVDDVKVMVHGSAAIMTGCFTTKGKEDGKDISGRYRFTDTWLLHDGKWRLAACAIAKMP